MTTLRIIDGSYRVIAAREVYASDFTVACDPLRVELKPLTLTATAKGKPPMRIWMDGITAPLFADGIKPGDLVTLVGFTCTLLPDGAA